MILGGSAMPVDSKALLPEGVYATSLITGSSLCQLLGIPYQVAKRTKLMRALPSWHSNVGWDCATLRQGPRLEEGSQILDLLLELRCQRAPTEFRWPNRHPNEVGAAASAESAKVSIHLLALG